MKCERCGAAINQGQKFCNQCGARINVNFNRSESNDSRQYEYHTRNQNIVHEQNCSEDIDTFDLEDFKRYCADDGEDDRTKEHSNQSNQVRIRRAQENPQKPANTPPEKPKSKTIAGLLALFLGSFGAQWFYLGKPVRAVIYLVASIVFPWAAFISIMEGFYFLFVKQPSFNKYVSATGFDSVTVMLKPLGWTAVMLCFVIFVSMFASEDSDSQLQDNPTKSMAVEETMANTAQQAEPLETAQPRATEELPAYTENVSDPPFENIEKSVYLPLQFQYAKKIGANLISFYNQEVELKTWASTASYDTIYMETELKLFGAPQYKRTVNYSKYIYLGDTKNNRPDGYGVLYERTTGSSGRFDYDGSRYNLLYMGNFKNGYYSGFGLEYETNCEGEYSYLNLCPFEYGTPDYENFYERWINFVIYQGMFVEGERSGKGNYFPNRPVPDLFGDIMNESEITFGTIITGDFADGKISGYAKEYDTGCLRYDGSWKNDKMDGYGKHYYFASNILDYEGEYKKGMRYGKGTSYHQDGSVEYSGQWKNDDVA